MSMSGFSTVLVPGVQERVNMTGTRRNAVLNILSMFQEINVPDIKSHKYKVFLYKLTDSPIVIMEFQNGYGKKSQ